ncbi:MAG TPA: glycosyl hydrolase family 28-related protein [Acidobacteriaceae bacterium]|nr:glycosyl hydrolase family 28-related protein [Acidobacteriaceae bacterium]
MAGRGLAVFFVAAMSCFAFGQSVYPLRPDDAHAVYLQAKADGVADDSDALQAAINQAQETVHHGIVFVPEGRYRLTRTVYVWAGIRLIGYGAHRPVFVLGANTPGFDAGPEKYMLWFTDERTPPGAPIADASEFTFFSAVSNIDFEIGEGNPAAVAIRFNVAQHSFVAHANFEIGSARAALEQIGNQAFDIHVHGGQYGIVTGKTSPAWQFLLMDSSFEGQKVAAISTHEAGMTLVRDSFADVPVAVEIPPGEVEQLYGRDLTMRDVGTALRLGDTKNFRNEITLENVACAGVGHFVASQVPGSRLQVPERSEEEGGVAVSKLKGNFVEERFTLGLEIGADGREEGVKLEHRDRRLEKPTAAVASDVPALPPMETWVNVRTLGARGDGGTDDTAALQRAIDTHRTLYFPSGFYRLTGSLRLRADTVLIGLSPFTTQLVLEDGEPAFQGEGTAIPLIDTPKGGTDIVTGIGMATGNANPRAAGVVWRAGARSLLEDVDFWRVRSEYVRVLEPAVAAPLAHAQRAKVELDAQYPSLWVKDGGGGIFRGIWSHAGTARGGLVIENTTTAGAIYQFSCEHHMKNEVRMDHAAHWKIFDLQTEEENPEGQDAVPVTLQHTQDVMFANTYMYRVSRTVLPKLYAVVGQDSEARFENVKVFSQTRLAFDNSVFDEGNGVVVRAHHFVEFALGPEVHRGAPLPLPAAFAAGAALERVATGFSNASGLTAAADGMVYFTDAVKNAVYRLDPAEKKAAVVAEVPQSPMALGFIGAGTLLSLNRDTSAAEISLATGTVTALPASAGPLRPDATLLLPVGLHATLEKLTLLLEHKGYQYRVGSNTALRSGLEDVPPVYFYAANGKTAIPAMPVPMYRPLHESSQLAMFAPGASHLIVSEDDAATWRGTLAPNYSLTAKLFAERGGTSVVEDKAGNVYIADGQVYVYDRDGKMTGVLEVPERPGSLCFGGADRKTLLIGARSSVYAIETVAAGR